MQGLNVNQFAHHEGTVQVLREMWRLRRFRQLTTHAAPIFTRGTDYVAGGPMVSGDWQREVVALLAQLSDAGYSQALFDIGANLGAVSYGAQRYFDRLHCFEPHPQLYHVLCANLYHARAKATAYPVGLGASDANTTLVIPKHNDGGGFVREGNAYTEAELSAKDTADVTDATQYDQLPITIRQGRSVLGPLFRTLSRFAIKIDTEGLEQTILREVAAVLPVHARVAIVFENLSRTFNPVEFYHEVFNRPGRVLKLASNVRGLSGGRKAVEFLSHGYTFSLTAQPRTWIGEIVFLVEPAMVTSASH